MRSVTNDGGRRHGVALSAYRRGPYLRAWAVAGAVTLVIISLATLTWVSSVDGACASCHGPQAKAARESSHSSVSCYGCHLSDGAWGFIEQKSAEVFRMYPASLGGVELSGPGRRIPRASCERCHGTPPPDVTESGGLRVRHDVCAAPPRPCDSCHNAIAHGGTVRWIREPVMDDCVACHALSAAPNECDTCHVGKLEIQRLRSGPWQVTHGPRWRDTHGMGVLESCGACHEPAKCVSCHKTEIPHPSGFLGTHGRQARQHDARCTHCHRTSGWCSSCHGIEMPHPAGFLRRHSTVATTRDDKTCRRCHAPEDCVNCHVAHTHPGRTQGNMGAGMGSRGDR